MTIIGISNERPKDPRRLRKRLSLLSRVLLGNLQQLTTNYRISLDRCTGAMR